MWLDDGQEYILTEMAQDFLNGDLPDMVMLSIHTGMREHESLDLKAAQVNPSNRTVTALKTKNHEPRTIPLNKTAYQVLARRLEGLDGSAHVFSDSDREGTQPAGFKESLRPPFRKPTMQGQTLCSSLRFMARHTFGTRLAQAREKQRADR
jgi:integrase